MVTKFVMNVAFRFPAQANFGSANKFLQTTRRRKRKTMLTISAIGKS
jgi:hypothetical protein